MSHRLKKKAIGASVLITVVLVLGMAGLLVIVLRLPSVEVPEPFPGGSASTSPGSATRGFLGIQSCPAPCGAAERRKLRGHTGVDERRWRRVDATTMYAEIEGEFEPEFGNGPKGRRVRVAMSHVFASGPGGRPDTVVTLRLTGQGAQRETMQKLINEIRFRAP